MGHCMHVVTYACNSLMANIGTWEEVTEQALEQRDILVQELWQIHCSQQSEPSITVTVQAHPQL